MTDSSTSPQPRSTRRRFAPVAVVASLLAGGAIAASLTGTLGAFTAQITNSQNTAATGTLTMQEANGAVTCNSTDGTGNTVSVNTYTCTTINKYGGSTVMVPGTPVSTTVTIKNTGTSPAGSFTLTPQACAQTNNGSVNGTAVDLCAKMTVGVTQQIGAAAATTAVATQTLNAFNTAGAVSLGAVPAGTTETFVFTVTLPLASNNTYQGLSASQPLVWNFTS